MPGQLRDVLLLPRRGQRPDGGAWPGSGRRPRRGVQRAHGAWPGRRHDHPRRRPGGGGRAAAGGRPAAPGMPRCDGMTTLTSLARAQAVATGMAQPVCTVRHAYLSDRPLVIVPLALAGEANAPLAALVGDDPLAGRLLVVSQPRNRDRRFAFAADLAALVVSYIEGYYSAVQTVPGSRGQDERTRFADAPQLLVPNPACIGFVRLLGRSTRFRRPTGEYAVDPAVPVLGRWLSFFAERAEHPGSCVLLAATAAVASHWASGQSPVEDLNLASLMGWIDPPAGMTGAEAAAAGEDPVTWPPAGPATDPAFDNEVLAQLIAACDVPDDDARARQRAETALRAALAAQVAPTWRLMWRAVGLLRG